jgi:hypothetical protein
MRCKPKTRLTPHAASVLKVHAPQGCPCRAREARGLDPNTGSGLVTKMSDETPAAKEKTFEQTNLPDEWRLKTPCPNACA